MQAPNSLQSVVECRLMTPRKAMYALMGVGIHGRNGLPPLYQFTSTIFLSSLGWHTGSNVSTLENLTSQQWKYSTESFFTVLWIFHKRLPYQVYNSFRDASPGGELGSSYSSLSLIALTPYFLNTSLCLLDRSSSLRVLQESSSVSYILRESAFLKP